MSPNHGPIAQHGSNDAKVGPSHQFRFRSPVSLCDVGYISEKFLCSFYLIINMLGPVELTVQGDTQILDLLFERNLFSLNGQMEGRLFPPSCKNNRHGFIRVKRQTARFTPGSQFVQHFL